jgi:O-antigen/teichoic acid export membrane protein
MPFRVPLRPSLGVEFSKPELATLPTADGVESESKRLSMPTEGPVEAINPADAPCERSRDGTRKFIQDLFFANLPLPFEKLRTYLWLIFFSRAFGPSGFGIWSLFLTTVGMALILTSMTQGNAMMRFLSGDRTREETNRVFSSVLAAVSVSSLIVALGLAAFSPTLSDLLFRDPRGRAVLLLIALIVPLETYFEEMRGLLRARRLNRAWAFFSLGREVPETLVLIAVVWWMRGPVAAVGGYLVTTALSVVLGSMYLARYQQTRLARPRVAVIRKYVPYGLALVPGALASSLSFAADRYLVGYYLDLRQVGIYSLCFTVSALGFFFVGPLNNVLLPEMAALHDARDWDQFDDRFAGVQKFAIGLAAAATALLVAFPQQILRVLTTRDFSSGGPTLAVLGFQGIFMSIVMLYIVMLMVRLHVWWTTVVWGGMGVMVLVMDVILLPRIGIIGAGYSQLISSVLGALLVVGLNWDIFRRTFRLLWIPQTGTALVGVCLVAHFWGKGASLIQSLEQIALGAMVFGLGLLITGYLRISDVLALQKALSDKSPGQAAMQLEAKNA